MVHSELHIRELGEDFRLLRCIEKASVGDQTSQGVFEVVSVAHHWDIFHISVFIHSLGSDKSKQKRLGHDPAGERYGSTMDDKR
jgi:hypothetical protein